MRIAMIGTGYVGLVSGACFSDFGHDVTCVDKDAGKIDALRAGEMPIFEPGLDSLVERNVRGGRLAFTTDLGGAVAGADAVFIAVGTPSRRGDGHADLTYVYSAAKEIARALTGPAAIVTKSTVPVGAGDEVERIVRETRPDARAWVVSNPEFLREGAAIEDFKRPDRIVIGTDDEEAAEIMREVYRPLYLNKAPLIVTSRRTAELIKYAANAFLATKITFINEIADLCESVGADVQDVSRGIGLDNRIGPKFLHAGPGYGGSCFPKDTLALLKTAEDFETPLRIVESVVKVNEARKRAMGRKVIQALGGDARGRTVALLGLSFKPNTDDMRDAPSLAIVQALQDAGAFVRCYDPEGTEQARPLMPGVEFFDGPYSAAEGADAVVLVTEWDVLRALDLQRLARTMAQPVFVDLRNVYPRQDVEEAGLRSYSVGRGASTSIGETVPSPARSSGVAARRDAMKRVGRSGFLVAMAGVAAACVNAPRDLDAPPPDPGPSTASADPRDGSGRVLARASLEEVGDSLRVRIEAAGLVRGAYGAHVHAVGRCETPGFTTAGPHWNPTGQQHGKDNPQGMHKGDLPNLLVGTDGKGSFEYTIPGASLRGGANPLLDADGASVVIHEKADDFRTDPSGNSGTRIACGAVG